MSRIPLIAPEDATPQSKVLLDAAQQKMGMVPNMLKGLAHSPAALEAYMSLSAVLGKGALRPALREKIALAAAGTNACDYCASAHTAIGKSLKIDEPELQRNLGGDSNDPAAGAALSFVNALINARGDVSDAKLQAVRDAGFSDGDIAEIVAHVALNTFTNYFNRLAQPEIDFPRVAVAPQAA